MGRHWTDQEYLALLEERGPDSATGIARHTGRDRSKVARRLRRLQDNGTVGSVVAGGRGTPEVFWSTDDPFGGPGMTGPGGGT